MCIVMREKVFGNYVFVFVIDCMWVIGREKNLCVMVKVFDFWGKFLVGSIFYDECLNYFKKCFVGLF